jgi:hypothetical protein
MILGMSVGAFTILHVIITLVAIGSGLIVVGGMFASNRLPVTTALFLFTTALTSLTGFLFPIHGFTPALGVGIVACVILAVALFALYKEHLVGACRWIYVITAATARMVLDSMKPRMPEWEAAEREYGAALAAFRSATEQFQKS